MATDAWQRTLRAVRAITSTGKRCMGLISLLHLQKAIIDNISGLLFSLDILFRLGQLLDRNVAVLEEGQATLATVTLLKRAVCRRRGL